MLYPALKTTGSSEADLTEAEKEAVLSEARRKKAELLEYEGKEERRRLWEEEIRRPWGPKELDTYIRWKAERNGIRFELDANNHSVYKALCRYFTGHESFETKDEGKELGWSLKKGILLCGPVGTGKTTLMGLFRANKRRSFKVFSCSELADRFAEEGHEVIQVWSGTIKVPTSSDTFYQNEIGVCFDDLGEEGVKKNFGNQVNVMADILKKRYDYAIDHHYTHITTNLTGDEIEQFYGTRVRSRMREMFNLITLGGGDRRR